MGATILRWFWRDGVRYRAYFRSIDGGASRELVIAAGSCSHAVPAPSGVTLDELPESHLVAIAANLELVEDPLLARPVPVG